jgi:predicted metal-dependent HD superfamily phosphohydrolase
MTVEESIGYAQLKESFYNLVESISPAKGGRLVHGWFEVLLGLYAEPHRKYHTIHHITSLLKRINALEPFSYGDSYRPGLDRFKETELAIWFHDAIYKIGAKDNEEESGRLCRSFLYSIGAENIDGGGFGKRVIEAIGATKHDGKPLYGNAARLMVDLDLAHFADHWNQFEATNKLVRKEYKDVPEDTYRWGRIGILSKMLTRPIYHILKNLEEPARRNLSQHIKDLVEGAI